MKTVAQLRSSIASAMWPSGEPENLIAQHGEHLQEALADLAQWVEGERTANVNVIEFCRTNYKCGMTVVPCPAGKILRVFTIANGEWCDPVFYRQKNWPVPECWARNLYSFPKALNVGLPKLPLGFQQAEEALDSAYGRARTGVWAMHQGNIYVAPWIQSNESLVIEWEGIKENWEHADPVNPEIGYAKAVKLYMQHAHERDYGSEERALLFFNPNSNPHSGLYAEARAALMHEAQLRRRNNEIAGCGSLERDRFSSEILDDVPPAAPGALVVCHVGNNSVAGGAGKIVADRVKTLGPNAIIGSGLIGTGGDYDATIGSHFHEYLLPYLGTLGDGADGTNAFWPAPNVEDWKKDGLATWKAWFPTQQRSYYDVCLGPIHFFFLSTAQQEPDGNWPDSNQALWLQARLALSTAPWKVVVMHDCAYGSVYSDKMLQWPFRSWGVDLVLSAGARNYERLRVDYLPVINNGLGGLPTIETIADPQKDMLYSYTAGYGVLRLEVDDNQLATEFLNADTGAVIDSLTLTK